MPKLGLLVPAAHSGLRAGSAASRESLSECSLQRPQSAPGEWHPRILALTLFLRDSNLSGLINLKPWSTLSARGWLRWSTVGLRRERPEFLDGGVLCSDLADLADLAAGERFAGWRLPPPRLPPPCLLCVSRHLSSHSAGARCPLWVWHWVCLPGGVFIPYFVSRMK